MKNKKYIIVGVIILIILIIILSAYLSFRHTENEVILPDVIENEAENVEDPQIIEMNQEIVTISNFTFSPKEITVPVGTMVVWINNSTDQHTITSNIEGEFSSLPLSQGYSSSFLFTRPGEYEYHCASHPNMQGKVIVVE